MHIYTFENFEYLYFYTFDDYNNFFINFSIRQMAIILLRGDPDLTQANF